MCDQAIRTSTVFKIDFKSYNPSNISTRNVNCTFSGLAIKRRKLARCVFIGVGEAIKSEIFDPKCCAIARFQMLKRVFTKEMVDGFGDSV